MLSNLGISAYGICLSIKRRKLSNTSFPQKCCWTVCSKRPLVMKKIISTGNIHFIRRFILKTQTKEHEHMWTAVAQIVGSTSIRHKPTRMCHIYVWLMSIQDIWYTSRLQRSPLLKCRTLLRFIFRITLFFLVVWTLGVSRYYITQYTEFEGKILARLWSHRRHPCLALTGMLWVSIVRYWEKIDRDISRVHCICDQIWVRVQPCYSTFALWVNSLRPSNAYMRR